MSYIGKKVEVTFDFGKAITGKVINQEDTMLMVDTGPFDMRVFTDKDTIKVIPEEETKEDELMSKVNYDEIQVGDLIGFDNYDKKIALGYVTKIDSPAIGRVRYWCHFSCKKDPSKEGFIYDYNLDYHWKVINFDELPESPFTEEETRVDELKVYTGKSTIEALLEGKVLERGTSIRYRLGDERLIVDYKDGKGWVKSLLLINNLLKLKLHEVATPQVGDWVRIKHLEGVHTAQLTKVSGEKMYADWEDGLGGYFKASTTDWEILFPEQVSEYKREQAFVKVGRKLNEFKHGDIVYIDSLGVTSVVITKKNDNEIKLHGINEAGKGYTAKPHQLTPIAFTEQQVDLS